MSRLALLLTLLATGCATPPGPPPPPPPDPPALAWPATIADAAWMTGNWTGGMAQDGTCFDERWLPPAAGSMLGSGRHVKWRVVKTRETLRLMEADGSLTMVVMFGPRAVPFTLAHAGEGYLRFENPDNDFPSTIVYMRHGDGLRVSLRGDRGVTDLDFTRDGTPCDVAAP